MTDKAYTQNVQASLDHAVFTWTGLANGQAGAPCGYAGSGQRSAQVLGTFGAGGTIVWEGSLDGGTTWATLNDLGGTALSHTSAALKGVREDAPLIRPNVTAGDGTTSITAALAIRKNQLM